MKWATTLAVTAAAVCLASVQAACPTNFVEVQDPSTVATTCIYFVRSKNTFYGTKDICELIGATLAKLTGDFHQSVILEIRKNPDLVDEAFWIGGTDEQVEGSWHWLDGETIPLGTPHWYPCNNQPNHGTEQNYLCLYTSDFFFHSLEGTRKIYGICEKNPI